MRIYIQILRERLLRFWEVPRIELRFGAVELKGRLADGRRCCNSRRGCSWGRRWGGSRNRRRGRLPGGGVCAEALLRRQHIAKPPLEPIESIPGLAEFKAKPFIVSGQRADLNFKLVQPLLHAHDGGIGGTRRYGRLCVRGR